jgi:3-hydroxy acid dehydrogenase/malonic semialdehyde reductase
MSCSLNNKIAFITGASSGIGKACATLMAQSGAKLILAARRKNRLEELAKELQSSYKAECYVFELDVSDRGKVKETLVNLPTQWQEIDILLNNAGSAQGLDFIHEGSIDDWEQMIDVNIKGLLYVTRNILPGMVTRKSGHIINIGSVAGHQAYPKGNVYSATKHAVRALTESMRMDLLGTNIRVSTVDPGLVNTEFSSVRFKGDAKKAEGVYTNMTPLSAEDIADAVCYCASRPPHVNICEIVVMPTMQAAATMVHRNN